jgi:dephospho-CoA kinase
MRFVRLRRASETSAAPREVTDSNPAKLVPHDPRWLAAAERLLAQIRSAMAEIPGSTTACYDHIGSTSVPGLAAKPYIDLQVRILPLPTYEQLTTALTPLGFERARGARPDSPGVARDIPRAEETAADEVWEKRLYSRRDDEVILHVRRSDSPWGCHTVWFRDWLRAHAEARLRYESTKRALTEQNTGKPDYDDYTRAKSAFFHEVHQTFVDWAQTRR